MGNYFWWNLGAYTCTLEITWAEERSSPYHMNTCIVSQLCLMFSLVVVPWFLYGEEVQVSFKVEVSAHVFESTSFSPCDEGGSLSSIISMFSGSRSLPSLLQSSIRLADSLQSIQDPTFTGQVPRGWKTSVTWKSVTISQSGKVIVMEQVMVFTWNLW